MTSTASNKRNKLQVITTTVKAIIFKNKNNNINSKNNKTIRKQIINNDNINNCK